MACGRARAPHLSLSTPPEIVWGSHQRLGSSTTSKREQDLPPRDLLPRQDAHSGAQGDGGVEGGVVVTGAGREPWA